MNIHFYFSTRIVQPFINVLNYLSICFQTSKSKRIKIRYLPFSDNELNMTRICFSKSDPNKQKKMKNLSCIVKPEKQSGIAIQQYTLQTSYIQRTDCGFLPLCCYTFLHLQLNNFMLHLAQQNQAYNQSKPIYIYLLFFSSKIRLCWLLK